MDRVIAAMLLTTVGQVAGQGFEPIPGFVCSVAPVNVDVPVFCGTNRSSDCLGNITQQLYYNGCPVTDGPTASCVPFGTTFTSINCTTFQCDRGPTCGSNTYCLNFVFAVISTGCQNGGDCEGVNSVYFADFPICELRMCKEDPITGITGPVTLNSECPHDGVCQSEGFQFTSNCTTFECSSNGTFIQNKTECQLDNGTCIPVGQNVENSSACEFFQCEFNSTTQLAQLISNSGCTLNGNCIQLNATSEDPSNPCVIYQCVDMLLNLTQAVPELFS